MRYLTTATPPRAIVTDYGLPIGQARPVFVDREIETGQQAGLRLGRDILTEVKAGHDAIVLRNMFKLADTPDAADREWWTGCCGALVNALMDEIADIAAIAIDHARYPGGATPEEKAWQDSLLVRPLKDLAIRLGVPLRIGMYGHHERSPTVWASADAYGWNDVYARDVLAWAIMPGQHRRQAPPATAAEFAGVLEALRLRRVDTVCVWSDDRRDEFGRSRTKPQDWHALLTAVAIVEGRALDVMPWSPPSWLPPVGGKDESVSGIFGGAE